MISAMKSAEALTAVQKLSRYLKDPKVSLWRKLTGLWALLYLLSPVDAVPDVIPVVGWLDDLGVLSVVAYFIIREVRRHAAAPRDVVIDTAPKSRR